MNNRIKKIVILGPESTGKSTLCQQLATHYNAIFCPEYARQFLTEHGTKYNYDNLLTIAQGQIKLEEEKIKEGIEKNKNKIIIDTDMYVMKVWCEYVFNNCHAYILEMINARQYDFYLLCDTDLPWSPDEMREYEDPKPRKELFHIYKDALLNQTTPWGIVSGIGGARNQKAIQLIDQALLF